MRKIINILLCIMIIVSVFTGCGKKETEPDQPKQTEASTVQGSQETEQTTETEKEMTEMKMSINGTNVAVAWEDNESVEALRELASKGLEITMSMYGGFEQVGPIGQDLPANDEQMTTEAGDIVLYSENQLVVFYGSNSWDYTRLGHVTDKTAEEMEELLGSGDVTITISMEDET